jgi:hypothetical protein
VTGTPCDPELVTGFVDGELDAERARAVAAHVEVCAACRAQAVAERELRARLRALPAPELPGGLEARVRRARPSRPSAAVRLLLPVAAALLFALWLRGDPGFVAWDLARDHDHCFSRTPLPAVLWSTEPRRVAEWYREQGTELPSLPGQVGELTLVGARYCPLVALGSAPHIYFASRTSRISVYLVPHPVRVGDRLATVGRRDAVRLLRVQGELLGIVGEREADVQAFENALRPALARYAAEPPLASDGASRAR